MNLAEIQKLRELDENNVSPGAKKIKNATNCSVLFTFEVVDEGIGIPRENLNNLFIAFGKQEDKFKMNSEGTGLGLSICKHIIEQMGGSVKVKSKIDKGTSFKVYMRTSMMVDNDIYAKLFGIADYQPGPNNNEVSEQSSDHDGSPIDVPVDVELSQV